MKTNFITSLKLILSDRLVATLLVLFVLACIGYCIYVGTSIQTGDLQVYVRHTFFSETRFYSEKWYYLLSFIMFGLILACVHSILVVKLYVQERRQIAIFFLWLSFLILVIAWSMTYALLTQITFRS